MPTPACLCPTELLGTADLAPGSGLGVRSTGVKACEGEAVVNNRKNKVGALSRTPSRKCKTSN